MHTQLIPLLRRSVSSETPVYVLMLLLEFLFYVCLIFLCVCDKLVDPSQDPRRDQIKGEDLA